MAFASEHAYKRARERCGWNKKTLDRMLVKVTEQGIEHGEVVGSKKRYLDGVYLSHKKASSIKLYGEYVFIFVSGILSTVYVLPRKYKKLQNSQPRNVLANTRES